MGEFDESLISVFNIIFESILFIFESVLIHFISFLKIFYFNCKLFYFRNKYSKDLVLEQKKGELELIRAKNMKILYKNILCKEIEDLVPEYCIGAPCPFAAFASSTSCLF
jgi:hypothetical protein